MDKRYQVFVSSTYEDLQKERQEVMQALLELDCMPSGMELFPAANEDQWTLIKKVIDECDYYIVILGGRYGSLGPEGISFTEMEYQYAESVKKPVIAFLHKDLKSIPVGKSESDSVKKEKLTKFREHVQKKMCKFWATPDELGSVVSRSMIKLMKSTPAIGWVRANDISDPEMSKENLELRKRIDELEIDIASFETKGPVGIETLAQGDDVYSLQFTVDMFVGRNYYSSESIKQSIAYTNDVTWNQILKSVLPRLIPEGKEEEMAHALFFEHATIYENEKVDYREKQWSIHRHGTSDAAIKEVIVQLHALGMIIPNFKKRSLNDSSNYWKLTPFGESTMNRVCAIHREIEHGPA
ncbi:MAG: DUF4062 domain-containing protein [Candidatus Nitrosopumilus sp. bin_7KS]